MWLYCWQSENGFALQHQLTKIVEFVHTLGPMWANHEQETFTCYTDKLVVIFMKDIAAWAVAKTGLLIAYNAVLISEQEGAVRTSSALCHPPFTTMCFERVLYKTFNHVNCLFTVHILHVIRMSFLGDVLCTPFFFFWYIPIRGI